MIHDLMFLVILGAALGSGLIAGTFFAFSTFVIGALARLPAAQAIVAMQSINVMVINPLFMMAFLGTAFLCAVASFAAWAGWNTASPVFPIIASIAYLIGTFGVTMIFNVPLNNKLAAAKPASADGANLWMRYVADWTRWNHVRMGAALVATVAFILALCQSRG